MFRESFLDGLQADLSQPIPWTSAFSFHLRSLGKEHWWSVPNTAGPFPMSCLSFASAPPNIKKIQVDKYARWRQEGRDRERLRAGGFQGWGRRQGELPHILCVTGNSLWILSRFCSARPSIATQPPPNPIPCIFPTLPGAARHLWPAFWSFCDFPSYQGQSLSVVGRLGSRQGADDTQSLSLSPLRTAIICTVFSSKPFPI